MVTGNLEGCSLTTQVLTARALKASQIFLSQWKAYHHYINAASQCCTVAPSIHHDVSYRMSSKEQKDRRATPPSHHPAHPSHSASPPAPLSLSAPA